MYKAKLNDTTNDATLAKTISVVSWNIRGIGDKLQDRDLQEYLFKNDIVILYETMKGHTFDINIPGFTFQHFAREKLHPKAHRASGGIGIFIRNELKKGNLYLLFKRIHCLDTV